MPSRRPSVRAHAQGEALATPIHPPHSDPLMFAPVRSAFASLASLAFVFGTAAAATPGPGPEDAEDAVPDVTALLVPVSAGVPLTAGTPVTQDELDDEAQTVIDQKTAIFVRPTPSLRNLALV